ncbi:hypothetical protein [Dactylosporangium sp. NPDC049140]
MRRSTIPPAGTRAALHRLALLQRTVIVCRVLLELTELPRRIDQVGDA